MARVMRKSFPVFHCTYTYKQWASAMTAEGNIRIPQEKRKQAGGAGPVPEKEGENTMGKEKSKGKVSLLNRWLNGIERVGNKLSLIHI